MEPKYPSDVTPLVLFSPTILTIQERLDRTARGVEGEDHQGASPIESKRARLEPCAVDRSCAKVRDFRFVGQARRAPLDRRG